MNIFPPEDCSWFSFMVSKKVLIFITFLLIINISNLAAQSSDEIQTSENIHAVPNPSPLEREVSPNFVVSGELTEVGGPEHPEIQQNTTLIHQFSALMGPKFRLIKGKIKK